MEFMYCAKLIVFFNYTLLKGLCLQVPTEMVYLGD